MCKAAVDKSLVIDKYTPIFPDDFEWFKKPRIEQYDVCVSAHTIEHLSDEHLIHLINHISGIPVVMFEAPIGEYSNDWRGYFGTHMLQIGWNQITELKTSLFNRVPEQDYIYLVHSFYAPLCKETIAVSEYERPYSSALCKDNFYGVQFHPEKSSYTGEQILKNFLEL